ncbi:MAG: MBOAT family protein, partial [Thermoleophilaceae bacterium]|nr:MBOAT family protein [Thermoleophilaceae bacterium]
LEGPRDPRQVAVGAGVALILIGLVKKVAIADYLGRTVVDPVFGVPQAYSAPDVILATYAYTAQIYCDFSGYTDMAIGLALLMGFVFPQNFDRPYRSASFREFWRRWHMTLSRFLRDFLYIPIGGNRGGRWKTVRNLMITMTLGGLWHGAAWTYVVFGAFHGVMLSINHLADGRVKMPKWAAWALTFNLLAFAFVIFRSQDLSLAGEYFSRLVEPGAATLYSVPAVLAIVAVIGFQLLPEHRFDDLRIRFERTSPVLLGAALAVLIALVAATVPSQGVPPFIYFQF